MASAFDDILPWKNIKRCTLADNGMVNHYYGDVDYAEDGSDGQVMVEIPMFWYKTRVVGDKYYWLISPIYRPSYKLHPAFIRNGVVKEKIYVGAFQASFYDVSAGAYADYYLSGDVDATPSGTPPDVNATTGDKLASIAGRYPLTKQYIYDFRTMARNRGSGWEQWDFLTVSALQMLFVVEFGSLNGQAILGQGVVSESSAAFNAHQTGETTGNGSYGITTDGVHAMSFRGIENFWGNVWQWVDGLNIKTNNDPYVADHNFLHDKFADPYERLGIALPNANGYISKIHVTENFDYGFLPSEAAGSNSTYFCDYHYQAAGNRVALVGGGWYHSLDAGPFYWNLYRSSANRYWDIGGRLLYIAP